MKDTYIPPATKVFELQPEGFIAETTGSGYEMLSNKREQEQNKKNIWSSDWSSSWE